MLSGTHQKFLNIHDIGEDRRCFLWLVRKMSREKEQLILLREETEKEQPLIAFLNEQTTVLPAWASIPRRHKEYAISFKS